MLFGFIVDRFRVLFVRILIVVNLSISFGGLMILNLSNVHWLLYITQFCTGFGVGLLIVESLRDVSQVIDKLGNWIRAIITILVNVSGFLIYLLSKQMLKEAENLDVDSPIFRFNLRKFGLMMLMVVLVLSGGRTLIWLRGPTIFTRNKREDHQMVRRNTVFIDRTSSTSATHFLKHGMRPSQLGRSSVGSIQQMDSSVSQTAKRISRRISTISIDIIGYQAQAEHSITDCFKQWEFWLLVYWVSANIFPVQCWINYQFNWLKEIGFNYQQIDDYFK